MPKQCHESDWVTPRLLAARVAATSLAVVCSLFVSLPALGQGDAVAGKRKTVTCNGCHGQAGMKSMPSLGGQHPDYFVAAMVAYQDGVRTHPTMRDVAGAFSLRDFKNFAAYYAEGAPAATETGGEAAPAAAERCSSCHGKDGRDPQTAATPRLAGQKAPYLEQTLRDYQSGRRKHAIMQPLAESLNENEILELSSYFASRSGLFVK